MITDAWPPGGWGCPSKRPAGGPLGALWHKPWVRPDRGSSSAAGLGRRGRGRERSCPSSAALFAGAMLCPEPSRMLGPLGLDSRGSERHPAPGPDTSCPFPPPLQHSLGWATLRTRPLPEFTWPARPQLPSATGAASPSRTIRGEAVCPSWRVVNSRACVSGACVAPPWSRPGREVSLTPQEGPHRCPLGRWAREELLGCAGPGERGRCGRRPCFFLLLQQRPPL